MKLEYNKLNSYEKTIVDLVGNAKVSDKVTLESIHQAIGGDIHVLSSKLEYLVTRRLLVKDRDEYEPAAL